MLETLAKVVVIRIFFWEVWYYNSACVHSLFRRSGRTMVTFRSSQASEGEVSPEPNTSNYHGLGGEPKRQGPWCSLSFDANHADGWGLLIGIFSRKFCERVGESQSAFWREWPSKLCTQKKYPNQEEVTIGNWVWFGTWRMNLYKRSCCSTWVLRTIGGGFPFARNGSFQLYANRHIHMSDFALYRACITSYNIIHNLHVVCMCICTRDTLSPWRRFPQVLSQREAASTAALEEANARLKKAREWSAPRIDWYGPTWECRSGQGVCKWSTWVKYRARMCNMGLHGWIRVHTGDYGFMMAMAWGLKLPRVWIWAPIYCFCEVYPATSQWNCSAKEGSLL